jgi:hypothetical protein
MGFPTSSAGSRGDDGLAEPLEVALATSCRTEGLYTKSRITIAATSGVRIRIAMFAANWTVRKVLFITLGSIEAKVGVEYDETFAKAKD